MTKGLPVAVARAIAKGRYEDLPLIGLNAHNVNDIVYPGAILKVKSTSGSPFVPTISDPTPLIYSILCEQIDTMLYLINSLQASLEISVNSVF
jgi:hypothetical protein